MHGFGIPVDWIAGPTFFGRDRRAARGGLETPKLKPRNAHRRSAPKRESLRLDAMHGGDDRFSDASRDPAYVGSDG